MKVELRSTGNTKDLIKLYYVYERAIESIITNVEHGIPGEVPDLEILINIQLSVFEKLKENKDENPKFKETIDRIISEREDSKKRNKYFMLSVSALVNNLQNLYSSLSVFVLLVHRFSNQHIDYPSIEKTEKDLEKTRKIVEIIEESKDEILENESKFPPKGISIKEVISHQENFILHVEAAIKKAKKELGKDNEKIN